MQNTKTTSSIIHANVRPNSVAETNYIQAKTRTENRAIIAGVSPHPEYDLVFQGGATITNLTFTNFYLGATRSGRTKIVHRSTMQLQQPYLMPI